MPAAAPTPILTLSRITFRRPTRTILQDLSWTVFPGQLAAIVGPNGCGKSTLLRLIAGYLWPASGSVALLGQTLGSTPLEALRQRVGILEASAVYPFEDSMTALDVVCSGFYSALTISYVRPSRQKWARARHALAQVQLGDRARQPYATLSTGERLRALIARALVRRPELLLLDEPTAGLDLPARESVLATLTALHRAPRKAQRPPLGTQDPALRTTIVIVTHHLEELLPGTSNILLLSHAGRAVASGPPRTVLTNQNMTAAYRWPIHVLRRHHRYHAHTAPQSWPELL